MLLPIKECGKGVNKDLLPSELAPGFWSDALNVEFSDGFARQRKGVQAVYTTPTAVPYFLLTYNTATARFLVQASTTSVFVDDGSTRTDITGPALTGGRDDRWTGGDLNGVLILNNGVDAPMYWNGDTATNLASLPAWPAGYTADWCRVFKNYVVFGGLTKAGVKYPTLVLWGDSADPGSVPTTYTSAATNDAGEDPVEAIGPLIDALQLGDVLVLYGQEGRTAMQYIGGSDVFRFPRLPGKDGLRFRACVAQTPKGHVFLSNGDVMLHNGGDAVSIAQGRIREWIFSTLDTTNGNRAFLTLNPQRSEVWIVFPSTGNSDCNTIAAWNWNDDTWAIHSISNVVYGTSGIVASALAGGTWATDSATWDSDVTTWDQDEFNSNEARLILATSTPLIGLGNTGSSDFGSSFSWHLERKGIRPSDADQNLILRATRWAIKGTAGTTASIYHGSAPTADATPTYATAATYTQGVSNWVNAIAKRGRYLAVKASGTSGQLLALRSFEMDIRGGGQF
jgi:hypothetical protein